MSSKKKNPPAKPEVPVRAAHEGFPPEWVQAEPYDIEERKLYEIAELLFMPEGIGEEARQARVRRALQQYQGLAPKDGVEGMLAAQMVGTHQAAMECLRRAAIPGQSFEGRDMALKHAQKLMALYTQQVATLNKHRGKGQQKVTVEHVHVEAGGQAIVGNVQAADHKSPATAPEMLEEGKTLDEALAPRKQKSRR